MSEGKLYPCKCGGHIHTMRDTRDRDGHALPPGTFRCGSCGLVFTIRTYADMVKEMLKDVPKEEGSK